MSEWVFLGTMLIAELNIPLVICWIAIKKCRKIFRWCFLINLLLTILCFIIFKDHIRETLDAIFATTAPPPSALEI